MGCDIHGYVDYDDPRMIELAEKRNRPPYVHSLGHFHIMRNYGMFGVLAGVRCEGPPVAERKGLPENLSYMTEYEAVLTVVEDDEFDEEHRSEHCCSRSDAERWGGNYTDEDKKVVHHPDWHSHSWLTTEELGQAIERYCEFAEEDVTSIDKNEDGTWPDIPEGYKVDKRMLPEGWENDKWREKANHMLLISEEPKKFECPPDFAAIHAAMKSLEESGMVPRFVFWFDN